MSGKIFINYRRGDDPGFTQALYQSLEKDFPAADLFMDVEGHIRPGDLFADVLSRQVSACDVFLAVVGPRWLDLLTARSGDTPDFVAIEITAAIEQGKRVIPVLVGGASLPRPGDLPVQLRSLIGRNAVALRPERFRTDCLGLINALRESLTAAEQERAARTEAERKAAEAARQRDQAQAAARAKELEAVRRERAAEGLSPQEIRKAEELANWNFVRDRKKAEELRDHLARFPAGITENYAVAALDELVWTSLGDKPALSQLKAYLGQFPKGEKRAEAEARIAALDDAEPSALQDPSSQAAQVRQEDVQKRWPSRMAPVVLSGLAIVAGLLNYGVGLATLGRIDITDTLHLFPFSAILFAMIVGFARLQFGRSSRREALAAAALYYLGSSILNSFSVSVQQQISAGTYETSEKGFLIALSSYFWSALSVLLVLGLTKLLPELVRRPRYLTIFLLLLPALRILAIPIAQGALGPGATSARLAGAIVGTFYVGILFAWTGYFMSRSRLTQFGDAA